VDLFGHLTLRTVTAAEIEDWSHGLRLGAVSVNNHRTSVGAFLTYGVRRGNIEANPVKAIDKVKAPNDSPEIAALMATLGLEWRKNALRHSFASFHLAKFEDAAALASQPGHTSTKLIFENYRESASPEEAELYWSIMPAGVPANVVLIGAA
jgi:hypothetical protein